ncbi:MAG: replication-associated recombination protein A [Deltaproteobacteria bacterium]|nr:replication-associated recombination protein A [Deltaproteobacteria bacterium]
MRPRTLEGFVGQEHIAGEGALIRNAIEKDKIFSMILWGPPGCGKTTLARIVAIETHSYFAQFSAVLSGVKDIRSVIEEAKNQLKFNKKRTILFVDEIHRFNKAQQDAFLGHVESGLITLIGATTENPSFEIIAALISRCRVITLNQLSPDHIAVILNRAAKDKENGVGKSGFVLEKDALDHLVQISDGDVRTALNGLEIAAELLLAESAQAGKKKRKIITLAAVENALQKKALLYDKSGEEHYNIISALHKSLRGSDPDAALYWLTRMLVAGEDPLYIARRMVRFASEDIGNADPAALQIALNAMEAFRFLGQPEGELALAQAAVYLATAPKSNSIYAAYDRVRADIDKTGALPVPMHIRNAPTKLMKDLGYGKGYQYAHDFQDAFIPQRYLPDNLKDRIYYTPSERAYEKVVKERLEKWRNMQKRADNKEGKEEKK